MSWNLFVIVLEYTVVASEHNGFGNFNRGVEKKNKNFYFFYKNLIHRPDSPKSFNLQSKCQA